MDVVVDRERRDRMEFAVAFGNDDFGIALVLDREAERLVLG